MAINFEDIKDTAVDLAQTAAQKAKELATIAKAKASIAAEEIKVRRAYTEIGKLYYRDYALGEEMDSAEYLPWCDKITASKAVIEDLKDMIDDIRSTGVVTDEEMDTAAAETPEDYAEDTEPEAPKTTE